MQNYHYTYKPGQRFCLSPNSYLTLAEKIAVSFILARSAYGHFDQTLLLESYLGDCVVGGHKHPVGLLDIPLLRTDHVLVNFLPIVGQDFLAFLVKMLVDLCQQPFINDWVEDYAKGPAGVKQQRKDPKKEAEKEYQQTFIYLRIYLLLLVIFAQNLSFVESERKQQQEKGMMAWFMGCFSSKRKDPQSLSVWSYITETQKWHFKLEPWRLLVEAVPRIFPGLKDGSFSRVANRAQLAIFCRRLGDPLVSLVSTAGDMNGSWTLIAPPPDMPDLKCISFDRDEWLFYCRNGYYSVDSSVAEEVVTVRERSVVWSEIS